MRGALIDTGFPGARAAMLAAVDSDAVLGAIATHWHEDHAGNVAALAKRGIPLWLAPETEATLRQAPPVRLYRRVTWGQPARLESHVEPFEPLGVDVIHTPGHSPDHHVVWDRETGTLFSGDLWLGVRARVVHATEDPYLIIASLERVRALSPVRMFDAHRGLVRDPARALSAKISWLGDTLGEIERRIAEGWSDCAIVKRILGGEEIAALLSRGEYSRRNLVAAVRRQLGARP